MKIDSAKIILFHPGKTGGTSIEHLLKDLYLGPKYELNALVQNRDIMFGIDSVLHIYLQHTCLRTYTNLGINFKEYKTITTVRRPYERILSCYYYNGKSRIYSFEDFITKNLEACYKSSIIKNYAVGHFAPQHFFSHLDDYSVDHIVHLESFEEDCKKAGLPVKYHYSKTQGVTKYKDRMEAYNKKTKDIVYRIYKEDFDKYGYDK